MKKKISSLFVMLLAISCVLAGCGSSGSSYSAKADSYEDAGYYEMAEEEAYYSDDVYDYNGAEEAKMASDSSAESEITDEQVESASNRKLIKNVNMTVETREFDTLVSNVNAKITQLGGYAESTNIQGNSFDTYSSNRRTAYIVARIPAKNLDSFVSSVESASNITSKSESAEDVTLKYSDVKSHIEALKVEQQRLNELLAEADSLETILALESRMTEVRYELESYESRLRLMDNQVDYSTVYLDIVEVKEYKPEPVEDPTFGERLAEEFSESLEDSFEAIQDFVIGFIAFLPRLLVILLILAVLGGIIFAIVKVVIVIVKKCNKNSDKKKNKVKPEKNDNGAKVAVALDTPPVIKKD